MRLMVGLGNPGAQHAGQRHNIGFMALDRIAQGHRFGPWRLSKFAADVAEGELAGVRVLAAKPNTFMNESGRAVGPLLRFYKLPAADLTVLHDELDLEPGRVRVKRGGGAAGHNGLRSIDAAVGPDYRRVRLGIGHPGSKERVLGHALGDFSKADQAWLPALLNAIADAAPLLYDADEQAFQNRVTLATRG